ncbi:MAG: response regulator [Alphaproteobacteria bacterium]|nr:response regulator [Alphaproteobacteria bacterium]
MDEKFNFAQVCALVVENDQYSTAIMAQILRGFGLSKHVFTATGEEAQSRIPGGRFDLMICESVLPDMPAGDLIRWVRRQEVPEIRFIPIVVLTGYTQISVVVSVRDAGANCVVRKPVSPNILLDHMIWAAKSDRPFIETEDYIGPCRRFKNVGPPYGVGRRKTDVSAELGEAVQPNMSQEEIDSLMRPTKVSIE